MIYVHIYFYFYLERAACCGKLRGGRLAELGRGLASGKAPPTLAVIAKGILWTASRSWCPFSSDPGHRAAGMGCAWESG